MPTLAQIKASVIEITKRPDLSAETDSALTRALMAAHLAAEFYFDVAEWVTPTNFVLTAELVQSIALPTRFRDVKYARTSYGSGSQVTKGILSYLPSSALFGDSFLKQSDVFWRAGANLHFRFSEVPGQLTIGYYRLPLPDFTDSWIAANYEAVLIERATAGVFEIMKNGPMKNMHMDAYREHMSNLMKVAFDA